MQVNMGMAGEFRCVVKRADGSTKIDTGYQKNLILNQGLNALGGMGGNNKIFNYCAIGTGNSAPSVQQTQLDKPVAVASKDRYATESYDYSGTGVYKPSMVFKYSFTNLNNVNITEVGLSASAGSWGNDITKLYMCTRALIKDTNGNPTSITVLSGEILEIYYKLTMVIPVADITGVINVLDGVGNSTAYNYIIRPASVGDGGITTTDTNSLHKLGKPINYNDVNGISYGCNVSNNDISTINSSPRSVASSSSQSMDAYVPDSFKIKAIFYFDIATANTSIRSLYIESNLGRWQMRVGKATDDSPIVKNNTQTLSIPIEFSWGRYEGAL